VAVTLHQLFLLLRVGKGLGLQHLLLCEGETTFLIHFYVSAFVDKPTNLSRVNAHLRPAERR